MRERLKRRPDLSGRLFICILKIAFAKLKLTPSSSEKGAPMHVAEIELYEILKEKIGDKEAKTLVEYIEAKVEKKFEDKKDILATKLDIEELRTEMQKMKADIIKWMFLFWIGQLASLIAILQIFFRK